MVSTIEIKDFSNSGFKIKKEEKFYNIKWSDIRLISLSKASIFKDNELNLEVWVDKEAQIFFTISETSKDWTEFIKNLLEKFPEIDPKWWADYPTKEKPVRIIIYERSKNVG